MRKKGIILVMMLLASVTLSGCKKAIEPDEAAILFVNRLIYDEKDDRFVENFVDGELVDEEVKKQKKDLASELIANFNEFGSVITKNQTEKLLQVWFEKMSTVTEYRVRRVKENEDGKSYTVQLLIEGIDFQKVYIETMDGLVNNMLADKKIAQNNLKLGDMTVELMLDAMKKAEAKKTGVKVDITVVKEKKKWKLDKKKQKEETPNILLAFLAGVKDSGDYTEEMGEVVQKVLEDAYKELDEEFETDEEKAEKEASKEKEKTPEEKEKEKKEEELKAKEKEEKERKKKEQTKETIETVETYDDDEESDKNKS